LERSGPGAIEREDGLVSVRDEVVEIIRERALMRLPEPVTLASGEKSRDFIDVKKGLRAGRDLEAACRAILEVIGDIDFDAVGGLTMGADQFSHVVAVLADKDWFVVRKEPKGRGTNKLVEGSPVGEGTKVLLVDDVVTTGGSIHKAYDIVVGLGATVVAATTVVDRGDIAQQFFDERGVPYFPLVSYRDRGIDRVGGGLVNS